MSRGLRNNNPGNIRTNSQRFRGEEPTDDGGGFKRFSNAAWGYRAMFVLLDTYRKKYRLNTIALMVARYAPPSENNTDDYVKLVEHWSGYGAAQVVDTRDATMMIPIVAAMSRIENGVPAVMADVEAGWRLYER